MTRGTLRALLCVLPAAAWLGCSAPSEEGDGAAPTPSPGRAVYLVEACPTCHGRDRAGTNTGPPIVSLRGRWDDGRLTQFLHTPAAFKQEDPRLRSIAERYRTDMPALFSRDEGRVRALVRYLLDE